MVKLTINTEVKLSKLMYQKLYKLADENNMRTNEVLEKIVRECLDQWLGELDDAYDIEDLEIEDEEQYLEDMKNEELDRDDDDNLEWTPADNFEAIKKNFTDFGNMLMEMKKNMK